jgi:hypothetical protein
MSQEETIKLWTIQEEAAWTQAQTKGRLAADGRRVWREFRTPYAWLREQMTERIPGYDGAYPMWAWTERPDLRSSGHLEKGNAGVRVEFLAIRNQVLVSDFLAWHSVLNDGYCSLTERDHDDYDARAEVATGNPEQLAQLEAEKRKSWERIFDIELLSQDPEWHGGTRLLQATLGNIALDQVCKVDQFTAR